MDKRSNPQKKAGGGNGGFFEYSLKIIYTRI